MNKEIKKAAELMSKKEAEKAAAIAKIDKELNATRKKLEELKAKLPTGETAEEYKKTLAEIRDNEAVIEFFEKKKTAVELEGLTPAEYMNITREVKAAADRIRADQGAAILTEIEKLNGMLTAYNGDIIELNKILLKAAQLHKVNPITLNAQEIAPANSDASHYIQAFFKIMNAHELLKKGIKV